MNGEVSPTARALRTLELLQRHPGISAADLAERLGVTDRAARRYIAILREAGVPVSSTRGRHGGYRIGRGLRLPPLVFTAGEALGLVMAVLDGQHAADDADTLVGAGLGKLIDALPRHVGRGAATMRAHARTVPGPADRPDPAHTSTLVEAVAGQRRVRIAYRSAAGHAYRTLIDPWAVVARYGRWYLLCFAHEAEAVRTLRIDRIQDVTLAPGRAEPPRDLDAVTLLEHHLGADWPYAVRVVFTAPYEQVVPWVSGPMGRLTALDGDRCLLVGSTNKPDAYAAERLAPVPYPFVVEGGPELQEAVRVLAERLTEANPVDRLIC